VKSVDEVYETTRLLLEEWAERLETPEPNRIDVYLHRADDLVASVAGLRVKRLGYLVAITGLDPGSDSEALELLYHFCTGPIILTLRMDVPKAAAFVPSLSHIIPSAEPFEREVSEMFGITFRGLRNPERLYLSDDWPEGIYPLRKDADLHSILISS
jgi:Ni,Fe-hydrogenase III component G